MIKFISFADRRMRKSLQRICRQAEEMQVFDEIEVFDEKTLMPDLSAWSDKLLIGSRGLGYYCWKSYLIRRELNKLAPDDILVYLDAGCHLNKRGRKRFEEYLRMLRTDPLGVKLTVVDEIHDGEPIVERKYTKGDVFAYFRCENRADITDTYQLAATHVYCRHCPEALELLKAWEDAWKTHFSLIDDTPSQSPNLSGFVTHRHDQSILSVLFKLRGGTPLPRYECYSPGDWSELVDCPVLDLRDRGMYGRALLRLWVFRIAAWICPIPRLQNYWNGAIEQTFRRRPYLAEKLPWATKRL